jgi:hypothetical protein
MPTRIAAAAVVSSSAVDAATVLLPLTAANEINTAATRTELEEVQAAVEVGDRCPRPTNWKEMNRNQRKHWKKRR